MNLGLNVWMCVWEGMGEFISVVLWAGGRGCLSGCVSGWVSFCVFLFVCGYIGVKRWRRWRIVLKVMSETTPAFAAHSGDCTLFLLEQ